MSHAPIQQQSLTAMIVNSNNNNKASSNNRKSSETVTSASDELEVEEQLEKTEGETTRDDLQTVTMTSQALTVGLEVQSETTEDPLQSVDSQPQSMIPSNDTCDTESSKSNEKKLKDEDLAVLIDKNEEEDVMVKKVFEKNNLFISLRRPY